jgi:hypothetical protein
MTITDPEELRAFIDGRFGEPIAGEREAVEADA